MKLKGVLSIFILLGLFCCGQAAFASALDNWQWRNPLPNSNPQPGPHTLYGIVFTNGFFLAVGDSGTASISTDGTNWTESATATTNKLNGVIFAGGLYLAVGAGGAMETSTNGTNWVLRVSGTTNSLAAAAYANGKFVAVGGNAVITSSNAMNWSPAVSGLSGATGVAGGSAGFLAINGTDQVFSSTDGSVWTSQTLNTGPNGDPPFFYPSPEQHQIVTFAFGHYLIGSSRSTSSAAGDGYIFSSADGSSWTTNAIASASPSGIFYAFFFTGNGNVIALAQKNFAYYLQSSADGINWAFTGNLPAGKTGIAGAYGNGVYVVVASATFGLPPIFTSADGVTWTDQQHLPTPNGPTNNFTSIAFSNGVYVVAATNSIVRSTNGTAYTVATNTLSLSSVAYIGTNFIGVGAGGKIYQSGDGLTWTQRNSGTVNNLHGIVAGGGLIVAVGDNGAIQTSPTGTIWTSRTSGTSLPLYGAAYAGGLFVAVGQLGTVLTSPDGIAWTGQDSGQLNDLLSVTFGSAGFAAVGPGGTILTSADGVNWTSQNSGTSATLESIAFGNGYYLATGDGATALTSPDGMTWMPRNLGATGGQNFYGAAFLNGRFDVVGAGGTILESDPVSPLFDVQIHPGGNRLTAFAPPGTNFRIQTSTNLAAQTWIDAATINNAAAITQWTNPAAGSRQLFYRAISP